jgi:DNA invertase Pin-like site-specific DNA recombinase
MTFGYGRVSTSDQHTETQHTALEKAGCERIYTETASGGQWDRPQLQECLKHLRKGDVLVVWRLDRLSRSLSDLMTILKKLEKDEVGFKSLTEGIDMTTSVGKLMMHICGAFAEFERSLIRERTKAGLARAKANGRVGGRRHDLTKAQRDEAVRQVKAGRPQVVVAKEQGISEPTMSRLMAKAREAEINAEERKRNGKQRAEDGKA